MHAPKIKLRLHTYQYATEIKIQVINKQCKDAMVQFKPNLISRRAARYFSTIKPWRLMNLLNEFRSRLVSKPCCLRHNESLRSLFMKSTLDVQILAYLTS